MTKPVYNIRDLAYTGSGNIEFKIEGWSRWRDQAYAELTVKRKTNSKYNEKAEPYWDITFEVSNYFDINEGYDANQAIQNKVEVMGAMAQEAALLANRTDEMELIFQEGEAFRKAEQERQMREAQELRDADPEVGKKLAKQIIEHMKKQAKELSTWSELNIKAFDRGTRRERNIVVTRSRAGLLLFSENYSRISKDSAIRVVADSHLGSLEVSSIGMPDPTMMKFLQSKKK